MKNFYRLTMTAGVLFLFAGCAAVNPFGNNSRSSAKIADIPLVTQSQITQVYASIERGQFSRATEALRQALNSMDDDIFGSDRDKIALLDQYYSRSGGKSIWDIAKELDKQAATSEANKKSEALTILDEIDSDTEPVETERPRSIDRDLHRFIQREIRSVAIAMGEDRDFELPRDFVFEIEDYIRKFQTDEKYREFFQNALRRSRKYIPALKHHFTELGFPEEIMYLAFVESAFNPAARSRANAVGLFQFIASTGRQYGLTINRQIDERKSPHRAAEASAEYLHDLVLELGSFTLALSSYNSGSGKTRQALRKLDNFRDRSFWALREQTTVLKSETREYVPQIFAAIVAARPGNPKHFGLEDVAEVPTSDYKSVTVPRSTSLQSIADALSITREKLIALNPDLTATATTTPRGIIDYPLFVPRDTEDAALAYFQRQAPRRSGTTARSGRTPNRQSPILAKSDDGSIVYRVQAGNTLSHLAGWFGCSIEQVKAWNPILKRRQLRVGDKIKIRNTAGKISVISHKVAPGETIQQIARRYSVKERSIRAWNGIGNNLQANHNLVMYQHGSDSPGRVQAAPQLASMEHFTSRSGGTSSTAKGTVQKRQKIDKGETFLYVVRGGNTLGEIARFFGVSISDIQKWNNIRGTQIRSGQKLKIVSGKEFRYFKYKVASGDTYSALATHFKTSQLSIRITNGKYRSALAAGELLTIFAAL